MKLLLLILVGFCAGGEVEISPKGALIILPAPKINITSTTTSPPNKSNDLNPDVRRILPAGIGSDEGVYYVIFPDGKLQRVLYSKTSIGDINQQKEKKNNTNTGNTTNGDPPKSFYYVQIPNDRLPTNLNGPSQMEGTKTSSTTEMPEVRAKEGNPTLVVLRLDELSGSSRRDPAGGERNDEKKGKELIATVLNFSEIKPLTGPVYTYTPENFLRLFRRSTT